MANFKVFSLSMCASLSLLACAPVNILNGLTPSDSYTLEKDKSYGALDAYSLDIYTPSDADIADPIIMFIHGGGWNTGNKDIYKFAGQAFAAEGYMTVIPSYRKYPEVIYPDFVTDIALAAAWTHEKYGRPIITVGHSAGAHIAALLALNPKYMGVQNYKPCDIFSGWVGLAGPYDFEIVEEPYLSIFPPESRAIDIQPISYASNSTIPALLLTGIDDETVGSDQTLRMEQALRLAGTGVSAKLYEDTGHIEIVARLSTLLRRKTKTYPDIMEFIKSTPAQAQCPK